MHLQKSQRNLPSLFGATQFSSMNYFSSDFIFLLWCGRMASYVPCGQLNCSCISNCDWIEWLRLICDFVTGSWLGCDCATTSSCAQWRGHVISHCPIVQVVATCRVPVQQWIYNFLEHTSQSTYSLHCHCTCCHFVSWKTKCRLKTKLIVQQK